MPLKNIDYSKTIIYKICCKDVNIKDIYIGSTTDFLRRRSAHKSNTININSKNYNSYVYEFIRNNGGFDNWEMVEVEKYEAKDSNDALKRERHFLELLGATLNKNIPSRTYKEREETNRDKRIEQKKEYYEVNIDKIKEKKKEWYEANKKNILEKAKEYNEANKEKIKEKVKEKITCICGSVFGRGEIYRHGKTKKHINYIESNDPNNYNK